MAEIDSKLKEELLEILEYFHNGLKDVEVGSGEAQTMTPRLEKAIEKLNKTNNCEIQLRSK